MDRFIKLQDVAMYMDLEPAEDAGLVRAASRQKVAPCGQVVGVDGGQRPSSRTQDKQAQLGVTHAHLPNGKTIPLLKTMLTSACERNCSYCPFRAGRSYRRTTFTPSEMARAFMDMYRAGAVEGLFLSSGIIGGGMPTQDKLLETADILRHKHHFRGYVHLKIMPGAEKDQVARAMQLANRLSVNLEAPNPRRLEALAPLKQFNHELLQPLKWIEEIRQTVHPRTAWNGRWPSSATQFVVGGADESDLELLSTAEFLFERLKLRRTYFSAFSPIADTPLENRPAEDPLRQHRLYQASFLFRDYGFGLEEMPFTQQGNLPRDIDPKLAWAHAHLREHPLELNRASREELLRVPGIGPKSAQTILNARRKGLLRELRDLQKLGVSTARLAAFVLLDGRRPALQLSLF